MSRGAKLPAHYIRDRVRHRTTIDRVRGLSRLCRDYAKWMAFQRWGPELCAASRAAAAAALGCSERSIQRFNLQLVKAGLWKVEDEGGIVAGRRFLKVFRMLFPQVVQGDKLSPPSSKRLSYWTRRATYGQQLSLEIAIPDRTTARQPRPLLPAGHDTVSGTVGYGTPSTTQAL